MKLTIKNSEWLRGTGRDARFYEGQLFDGECWCVQGLYCRDNGIKSVFMEGYVTVSGLYRRNFDVASKPEFDWLIEQDCNGCFSKSDHASQIEKINDDTHTTDAEKIEQLKPLFATHGVEIEYREDL